MELLGQLSAWAAPNPQRDGAAPTDETAHNPPSALRILAKKVQDVQNELQNRDDYVLQAGCHPIRVRSLLPHSAALAFPRLSTTMITHDEYIQGVLEESQAMLQQLLGQQQWSQGHSSIPAGTSSKKINNSGCTQTHTLDQFGKQATVLQPQVSWVPALNLKHGKHCL